MTRMPALIAAIAAVALATATAAAATGQRLHERLTAFEPPDPCLAFKDRRAHEHCVTREMNKSAIQGAGDHTLSASERHKRVRAKLTSDDRAQLSLLLPYVHRELKRKHSPKSIENIASIVNGLQPGLTAAQLQATSSYLSDELDSENEISEMSSMELQMLMDNRSKLLQTASDIEKSQADTNAAIVGNIKQ